jgi:formate hydrogenlyase subunit 3/multisubunit Na+/H+ antiporter MnhD subunit
VNAAIIERLGAVIAGIVVAAVAFYALYVDRKSTGTENQVFKLMLLLLGLGAILALLAGLNVIGFTPPAKGA